MPFLLLLFWSFPPSSRARGGACYAEATRGALRLFDRAARCGQEMLSSTRLQPHSSAAVELGHDKFAMAQRLGRRQPAIGGADHHVDERLAGLLERQLAAQAGRPI